MNVLAEVFLPSKTTWPTPVKWRARWHVLRDNLWGSDQGLRRARYWLRRALDQILVACRWISGSRAHSRICP